MDLWDKVLLLTKSDLVVEAGSFKEMKNLLHLTYLHLSPLLVSI